MLLKKLYIDFPDDVAEKIIFLYIISKSRQTSFSMIRYVVEKLLKIPESSFLYNIAM